jgi:ASC-1-like (ASCH) protein
MTHELKINPEYFTKVITGEKRFEIRKNDRDFKLGDYLTLREFEGDKLTGMQTTVYVTYILHGPAYGLEEGFCIMSIR